MKTRINPIKMQSRKWLLDALIYLMKEKEFRKISIKEITDKAGLDRKTFYRNFKSKEEVLEMPIQEACLDYVKVLENLPELSSHYLSVAYFSICHKYLDLFRLLNQNGLFLMVLLKFDEYLPYLNNLFANSPNYRYKSDYELVYQAGGFWNATLHWINNGTKETPEEIAEIISSLMPSSLKSEEI